MVLQSGPRANPGGYLAERRPATKGLGEIDGNIWQLGVGSPAVEPRMSSSLEENKKLVRRYFEVIGNADLEGIASLMDPKLRFRCAGGTGFEDSVVFRSPGALITDIRENLGKLYDPEVGLNPEILNLTAEDDRVVAEVRLIGRSAVSGETYDNLYVFMFWIHDGKFTEIHEHLDTAYASAKLLGPAGFATGADLPWLEKD